MLKNDLLTAWILCKKNISLYIKRGPVLIFGLLFPFFITLSWVIGRELSPVQIFIGIVAMTAFFTSTAISPVVLPQETRGKTLERQLFYPVSINQILLGIVMASFLYSFIITLIVTIAFSLILGISILSIFQIFIFLVGTILMVLLGSLFGLLISALPTDMTSDVMVLINVIKFPLIFISGIFIPLSFTPIGLFILSIFSPITFFTDLLRFCVIENNLFDFGFDLLILLLWIILLSLGNVFFHKRTMPKRLGESASKAKKMKKNNKGGA